MGKEKKLAKPFSFHFDADIEGLTESDGEIYTVTSSVVVDQLKYVIEKLQQKGCRVKIIRMTVTPLEEASTKKSQG